MKDRIPLSNGKNNNIKLDLTGISSWEQFIAANTAGTLKADVFANNDGTGTEEVGTALNKANLLSDATAEKMGLSVEDNPTINDAFSKVQDNIDNVEKIGDIKVTTQTDLGDKWLLCNGAKITQEDYPELYNEIILYLGGQWDLVLQDASGSYSSNWASGRMAYGNGYYMIMLTSYYAYATSISGPWTIGAYTFNTTPLQLSFIDSKFVFICTNDYYSPYINYASTPTGSWTQVSLTGNPLVPHAPIRFVNGYYFVIGNDQNGYGRFAYSSTLTSSNWTYSSTPPAPQYVDLYDIAYFNNKYIIIGYNISGHYGMYFYYPTLYTSGLWTSVTIVNEPYGTPMNIIIKNGVLGFVLSKVVITGVTFSDMIYIKSDLSKYYAVRISDEITSFTKCYLVNDICIAVGIEGHIAYSDSIDGDWTVARIGSELNTVIDVLYVGEKYYSILSVSKGFNVYSIEKQLPTISHSGVYAYIKALN